MANKNEKIQQIVELAVGRVYDAWAAEHPSLAAVIDRIKLTERTVQSLRETPQYKQAVRQYHEARNELQLLETLANLAGPAINAVLAGS